MVSRFNSEFIIVSRSGPLRPDDLHLLKDTFLALPDEYVEIVMETGEMEALWKQKGYFRIWAPATCIEMNEAHGITGRMPTAFPFGDDGGGRLLFFDTSRTRRGVYVSGFGDLDIDDAIYLCANIQTFIKDTGGIQRLYPDIDEYTAE